MANTTPTETRRAPRLNRRAPGVTDPVESQPAPEMEAQAPIAPISDPANENDPATAAIIANLKRKPSSTPFFIGSLLSLTWMAITAAIYVPGLLEQQPVPLPALFESVAIILMPAAAAMAAAYLVYRAQQLRQVSESLTHTAMKLVRPQDIAADSLAAVAMAIREEMNSLVGGVEQAMQRAGELEGMVHREIASIERAFGANEERIRNLISGIENQRVALQQAGYVIGTETGPLLTRLEQNTHSLDQIIQVAQSALTNLDEGLKGSAVELTRTVEDIVQRGGAVNTDIMSQTQRMDQLTGLLVNGIDTFRQHVDTQVQSLSRTAADLSVESSSFSEAVRSMEAHVTANLRGGVSELSALHTEVVRTVDRLTGSLSEQIKSTSSQVSDLLQTTGSSVTWQLENTSREAVAQMQKTGSEITFAIGNASEGVSEKMQGISSEFVDNVTSARDQIFSFLEEAGNTMNGQLSATASDILARMEQTSNLVSNRVAAGTSEFAARVEQQAIRIAQLMDETVEGLKTRAEENTGSVATLMQAAADEIAARLDNSGVTVAGLLTGTAEETVGRIEQSTATVTSALGEAAQRITGGVESEAGKVSASLNELASQVTGRIDQSADNLNAALSRTASMVVGRIEETAEHAGGMLEHAGEAATQRMELATENLGQIVTLSAEQVTGRLEETAAAVRQGMSEATSRTVEQLGEAGNAVLASVNGAADSIIAKLGDSSGSVIADIQAVANLTATELSRSTEAATGTFTGAAEKLAAQVEAASKGTLEKLETVSSEVGGKLETAGGAMFERLESTARLLGSQFDEATEILGNITGEIAERMDATSTSFGAKLDEASNLIKTDLDRAGEAFHKEVHEAIGTLSTTFRGTASELLSQLDEQSRALEVAGQTALTRLEETSTRFAEHVRETNTYFAGQLNEAAAELDNSLSVTGTGLSQRLEEAAGSITGRLEDVTGMVERAVMGLNNEIERVLVSREDALNDLIDRLGKRSGDVEAMMRSYLDAIEEQLAAAEQRSHEIGRFVTQQAEETAAGLDAQIHRLEELADAKITSAARQLRASYENAVSTMNEMLALSAGEFTQTAQGMRATAEQVARDIELAREELGTAIASLPEETRANADAMRHVVAEQINALQTLAEVVKKQAGTATLSLPRTRDWNEFPPGKSEGTTSAPQQVAGARKASLRPVAKETRRSVMPELARDVVAAMEGSLPRDLERRWSGGEDGVYLRRLANSRSGKLEDALSRRYGAEDALTRSIDNYIDAFAELMDELSAGNDGEEQVEKALGSDAGKVFMLLAKVSGRMPA